MKYIVSDNFTTTDVLGEMVIVPVGKNVKENGNMLAINKTGEFILERITKGVDSKDIIEEMVKTFDAESSLIEADFRKFTSRMIELGYLSEKE